MANLFPPSTSTLKDVLKNLQIWLGPTIPHPIISAQDFRVIVHHTLSRIVGRSYVHAELLPAILTQFFDANLNWRSDDYVIS